MVKMTFKIEGLKELKEALEEEFPKATATNIQKRALVDAAQPMVATAQALAPVAVGTLQQSIKVSPKLSSRQKSKHKKESRVEMFVGPAPVRQAVVQEFGTVFHAAHPYMRPAWDSHKLGMLNSIKKVLEEQIEKARQRALRKTARLLAKIKT
jgi:HK97 gp10 family phage protein